MEHYGQKSMCHMLLLNINMKFIFMNFSRLSEVVILLYLLICAYFRLFARYYLHHFVQFYDIITTYNGSNRIPFGYNDLGP